MTQPSDMTARLRRAFETLEVGLLPDKQTIPTAVVTVDSGARLSVFRVHPVEAPAIAWRVRGFDDAGEVKLAVILGAQDGRAMVTAAVTPDQASQVLGGMVTAVESSERSLNDLSEAMANAVRTLMGPAQ